MSTELENWERMVSEFGGRINSPTTSTLEELSRTVLGSTRELPTAGAVAISAAPITLAEMNVSRPLAVDVSFSYPNFAGAPGIFNGLDVGDGFVQISWGVKGAIEQVARVDGKAGWRYPFVASHLLVQYFPVDTSSTGGKIIPVGQSLNLQIRAIIAPASGAPCFPLTKTLFYPNVAPGGASQQKVPAFAAQARMSVITNIASDYTLNFFASGAGVQLSTYQSDGAAGSYPRWVLPATWFEVPQRATIANIGVNLAAPVGLTNPTVAFKLAL